MDVIRHEAVGQNVEARVAGRAAEQIEIDLAVGVGEKDALAVGSALRDVMRKADGDRTGKSRHRQYSGRWKDFSLRNIADCPRSSPEVPRSSGSSEKFRSKVDRIRSLRAGLRRPKLSFPSK